MSLWLHLASLGFSLVVVQGAPHCGGFPCCRAQSLGARASVVGARWLKSRGPGLWSVGAVTVAHGLAAPQQVASPRPGIEPVLPALADGFLPTAPPEKPVHT